MLNMQPVVGMEVTFKADYVELDGGQELRGDISGKVATVYSDYIVVLFEDVVSDKGGHLYHDTVSVPVDHIPDDLEGFEWIDEED
jgi:hypothetical protein